MKLLHLAQWLGPVCLLLSFAGLAGAQDAQWVWAPGSDTADAAPGTCYFRKTFTMKHPESGEVQIACDDSYELFVNGRAAGQGADWRTFDVHDVTSMLIPGKNTIAVKAKNLGQGSAGLVARVLVKDQGDTYVAYNTNASWKVNTKGYASWQGGPFNDKTWPTARVIGPFSKTEPWLDEVQYTGGESAERFVTSPEFRVEQVIDAAATGSLTAIAFNEFGQIVAARENGPLILIQDTNKDGVLDKIGKYCEEIRNCQGLLPLNGQVFAVGEGPRGAGLYRLSDTNTDGKLDDVKLLLKFKGEMGEHGPHAVALGPDGLIYVMLGNHTRPERPAENSSPYRHYYEGDLVTPRYEDAGGHAVGIKAPGGTVIRTDSDGSFVETFAGGLRNAYDMAFNKQGDLLTSDSDMEWDIGMPWYRPTRISHLTAGSEFGWRSGWAVWPEYYIDSLPGTIATGRGSPTGVCVYDHFRFPVRYQNALFVGDWSRGRILAIKMKPTGASYTAQAETFVEGKPLNVTDLTAGPDGSLYFCTGGRGTEGGVYRVVWQGTVPPNVSNLGTGIEAAVRQPQLNSAFARQKIAVIKQQQRDQWSKGLASWARNAEAKPEYRARALDLMQLFGPFPAPELLIELSQDPSPVVRAKAAYMMGIHIDPKTAPRLMQLLQDKDLTVSRIACESLVRAARRAPFPALAPLLNSNDRFLATAARGALEISPVAGWKNAALSATSTRVFLQSAIVMMAGTSDAATCKAVLTRCEQIMNGYVSDDEFLGLLRVAELALIRGQLSGRDVPTLRTKLAEEFPCKEWRLNRELVRLLVYMQEPSIAGRYLQQLNSAIPLEEKMHLAMHARFLKGWTGAQKLQLIQFYEQARTFEGGHSFVGYIDNVSRDFMADFNPAQRATVLAQGATWPNSTLAMLATLPDDLDTTTLATLRKLDRQLASSQDEAADRLRIGLVAVLARSGDPSSMTYLREIFRSEPARRKYIAVALAQQPEGENWPLLVQSLPSLDGPMGKEVLEKLTQVDQAPYRPESIRQAILLGLRLGEAGGQSAVALLEKWTGEAVSQPDDKWDVALAAWQKWFEKTYPDQPAAAPPVDTQNARHTYKELMSQLTAAGSSGDARHGAAIFVKAQCNKCHRFGARGESIGPDLTTVSQRFQTKDILESILYPSQVISDQYTAKKVLTVDGVVYTGIVAKRSDGSMVVLQADGQKISLTEDDVDQISPSNVSAMPEGLLDSLSKQEIVDLFAYLKQSPNTAVTRRPGGAKTDR